jgi:hypothetical protein
MGLASGAGLEPEHRSGSWARPFLLVRGEGSIQRRSNRIRIRIEKMMSCFSKRNYTSQLDLDIALSFAARGERAAGRAIVGGNGRQGTDAVASIQGR